MADQVSRNQERLLIYDGDCRLCMTAKAGLERWGRDGLDRSMRFVPYQSEEAARSLGAEYQPGRPEAAFLLQPDGKIQRGLEAFLPLLPGLPGGRLFLTLARSPRGRAGSCDSSAGK